MRVCGLLCSLDNFGFMLNLVFILIKQICRLIKYRSRETPSIVRANAVQHDGATFRANFNNHLTVGHFPLPTE